MKEETKKQLKVYAILVIVLAVCAALSVFFLDSIQVGGQEIPMEIEIPIYLGALANFGMMLIGYGLIGLLGYYLSKKLGWPGIFNNKESWRKLFLRPLYLGVIAGIILIVAQKVFVLFHTLGELPHPGFPLSFFASITAGIGEELMFRLFLVSFWAFILHLIFKRFKKQNITNWIAIIIAALVFGVAHFPAVVILYGFTSLSQIPIIFIIEIFLLNGVVGIIAGREFIKYGFIAAIGVHFWADIIWHLIYGLF